MSTYPTGARRPGRSIAGSFVVIVFVLLIVGYFIYNMAPNLVSSLMPGSGNGIGGEWVGLVKLQNDMMDSTVQPAAVRLQMHPTALTSIMPTYKMTGEMTVAGHSTPITFSSTKVYTGHSMPDMNGMIEDASDARFKGAIIEGGLKNSELTFTLQGMAAGSTAKLDGQLRKGTDSDYTALQKQIK